MKSKDTYAECAFVALGILQAMCIAVLFSLACSALPYFQHFIKTHDFRCEVIEHKSREP